MSLHYNNGEEIEDPVAELTKAKEEDRIRGWRIIHSNPKLVYAMSADNQGARFTGFAGLPMLEKASYHEILHALFHSKVVQIIYSLYEKKSDVMYSESLEMEGLMVTKKGKVARKSTFWEDWSTISLILYSEEGDPHTFTFGKRAIFHYKCDLESQCFLQGHRKFDLENKLWVWGHEIYRYNNKSLNGLFEDRETVVIEEKDARINFYFGLKYKPKDINTSTLPIVRQFAVQVIDSKGVKCTSPVNKQHRPCADHPRVSYVTFRKSISPKNPQVASYYEKKWP